MIDLSTTYLGIKLDNPIIAGACGLTSDLGMIEKLQESGVGAIVCKSLFQEEIELEYMKFQRDIHQYDDINAEMLTIFPDLEHGGPKEHLYWLKRAKEEASVPVIGSLNAQDEEIWLDYARRIEDTGVDAIELNLYRTPEHDGQSSEELERRQLSVLSKVKEVLSIPVSIKISPFYTNLTGFIQAADAVGVDGVVVFNTLFAPDMDIIRERHTFPISFSRKEDNLFTQKYTGLIHGNISGDLCAGRSIMDGEDIVKMILAGADAVQVVSTLYRNTHYHIGIMKKDLEDWMKEKGYSSLDDFRGKLSRKSLGGRKPWLYKRSQYVKMLMQDSESLAAKIF